MPGVTSVYLHWIAVRAVLHRGYWLVTSLYLVLDAGLSPFELVFLGTAQGIVALVIEVPAGIVADTISRKWALVISHALIGSSMVITGLVTSFPALVATQILWGIGWSFASGADVAWVTDELERPDQIGRVLAAAARWEQLGAVCGLVGFGLLAAVIGRGTTMVAAGTSMIALGLYVLARFTERRFTPAHSRRWQRSMAIFRSGVALARHDHEILLVLIATVLINGAAEAYGRLFPKRLVDLGLPERFDSIIWFTVLGIAGYAVGALTLRIVEARIDGASVARRMYAAACFVGVVGLIALAAAPGYLVGSAGVLLVGGIALTVTRAVGVIWVNRRTTSDVRATMQSMLAQAEYSGEILLGVTLGAIAQFTTISIAFACSASIFACAGLLVVRSRSEESI
jgi:MFS family permease